MLQAVRSYAASHKVEIATAVACSLFMLVAIHNPSFADLPDFGAVTAAIKTKAKPAIKLFRFIVAIICFCGGLWEAYKASKGNSKGWINFLLMWIVAGVCLSPSTVTDLLNLGDVESQLSGWGIFD